MLEYNCHICQYKTNWKTSYNKHLETNKHIAMDEKDKEISTLLTLVSEGMELLENTNKEIAELRVQIMLRDIEIKELKRKK